MTRASDLARLLGAGGTLNAALSVDTISEKTSGSGVTIDSLNIKDSGIGGSHIGGRRNIIINGAMHIAQRGTSTTGTGYLIDRYNTAFSGPSVTTSQQSLTSGDPYNDGFRNFIRLANTSVSSATDAYVQIKQPIEAQNLAKSGWQYTSSSSSINISFWVRSSLAGTYYVHLRSKDTAEYIRNVSFTLVADTWKKVSASVAGNSNLVFDNDNGNGLEVIFVPYYGTAYTGGGEVSSTDWYSRASQSDAYFPNYAQNWANTSSATFDFTGLQIEVGSQSTPFEHRSFGEELALCQRYFQYHVSTSTAARYYADQYSSGTLVLDQHHSPMRAVASGTVIGTWIISNITGQPSLYVGTEFSHYLARSVSSTGRAYFYAGQNDGVSLDAEL